MKLSTLNLLFGLATSSLFAQNQEWYIPNYDGIEKAIEDEDGEFYYPKILKSFLEADTNLTRESVHHLYYGAVVRSGYSPYGRNVSQELPESIEDYFELENPSEEQYETFRAEMDKLVEENPLDLVLHLISGNVAFDYGDSLVGRQSYFRYNALMDVIEASGDGLTKETAIHVIRVTDEYTFLRSYGFNPTGQALIEHRWDEMKLAENQYGIESLYFDISTALNSMGSLFDD